MKNGRTLLVGIAALVGWTGHAGADDWPQWLGPERDGVWRESGIVEKFPEGGPEVAWRVPVALGYGGPAVAGGKVFLMDFDLQSGKVLNSAGDRAPVEGVERVRCFDADSGKAAWTHEYAAKYDVSYPGGPRCTPTVAGDLVIALGTMGKLTCLKASDGEVAWEHDFGKEYGAPVPHWGHSAHPLVHDGMVICMVGGEGSLVVAFDLKTGKEKWRSLTAGYAGYCPPQIIEHNGVEQLLVWHPEGVSALVPGTGREHWTLPLKATGGTAVVAPRKSGNRLFASGYNKVGALMELDDKKPGAKFLWRSGPKEGVYCVNSTPHLRDGLIYGVDVDSSALVAVSMEDGARLWTTQEPILAPGVSERARHGTAFLVYHEPSGKFWLPNEGGELIIAELDREGYTEIDRAKIIEPTNETWGRDVVWSHPAFAMKSIFMRNDEELVRVNLGK